MDERFIEELVARGQADGLQLTKRLLESALDGEMTDHLGYAKHDPAGKNGGNSRNGKRSKTVHTDVGPVEIEVPRDRESSFEPQIVKKRQFIDCIDVKIREGQVANRPIYVALAVTAEGHRDILGLWAGTEGGEGAEHWLRVLTELKNRGVEDVVMLVCDGLKGLPDAVGEVWPATVVQTFAVHLLRASFRYTARQDWDKIAKMLKPVCTAPTEDAATTRFLEFTETWGEKYPAIVRLWENAWGRLALPLASGGSLTEVGFEHGQGVIDHRQPAVGSAGSLLDGAGSLVEVGDVADVLGEGLRCAGIGAQPCWAPLGERIPLSRAGALRVLWYGALRLCGCRPTDEHPRQVRFRQRV